MRLIINADDCGLSKKVDAAIEEAILKKRITSTTIMANMEDFMGAMSLYKKYSDRISFGCHLNLTQGCPLLKNQLLLDKGYYIEKDGHVMLNGRQFWNKFLTLEMRKGIALELQAQVEFLLDNGVKISHLDSHHHIHTNYFMMGVIASLAKKYEIRRIRRVRNYMPMSVSFLARQMWANGMKILNTNLKMTDYFGMYSEFDANPHIKGNDCLIEIECHPGGEYIDEERILMQKDLTSDYQLINYNDIKI